MARNSLLAAAIIAAAIASPTADDEAEAQLRIFGDVSVQKLCHVGINAVMLTWLL